MFFYKVALGLEPAIHNPNVINWQEKEKSEGFEIVKHLIKPETTVTIYCSRTSNSLIHFCENCF